jgi:anti-sigma B factor antagonist
MEMQVPVDIVCEGNAAIASFKSTCISDVEEITSASTQINKYIEANRPNRMVFDFAGVKFFSSQVLGLLLEARARLQAYAGQVVITTLSPQLQRVFKITNLDRIFTFYPDRRAALTETTGHGD